MVGDSRAGIISAVTHHRPAVIPPGQDDVQFISTIGTILVLPNQTGLRMKREPQRIAMTERKDLRLVAGSSNERIVRRRRSVVAKAESFAAMAHQVLSALIERASHSHEQIAIRRKHDSRCGRPPIVYRVSDENIADIEEGLAVETSSCKRRRDSFLQRFRIREINELVFRKPRMQRDVHQSGQLLREHFRHAGYRFRIEHAVLDQSNAPGTLGYQDRSVGKEGKAPRMRESLRNNHDADLVLLRSVEREGPVAKRRSRYRWSAALMG